MPREKLIGFNNSTRYQFKLFPWIINPVGIPGCVITFQGKEKMAQILRIRPIWGLHIAKVERFSCDLHEIHKLMDFQQTDEGIH